MSHLYYRSWQSSLHITITIWKNRHIPWVIDFRSWVRLEKWRSERLQAALTAQCNEVVRGILELMLKSVLFKLYSILHLFGCLKRSSCVSEPFMGPKWWEKMLTNKINLYSFFLLPLFLGKSCYRIRLNSHIRVSICVYMYIYIYINICVCVYIYIHNFSPFLLHPYVCACLHIHI